jgi:hypothetical protein
LAKAMQEIEAAGVEVLQLQLPPRGAPIAKE